MYLYRQHKIEFLKKHLNTYLLKDISEKTWIKYYSGNISDSDINYIIQSLPKEIKNELDSIKPTRKRLISEFNLNRSKNNWNAYRVPAKDFGQENALINSNATQDYRAVKRKFKELPKTLESKSLKIKLKYIAQCLYEKSERKPTSLNIITHHTIVYCFPNDKATNSPEGIHQDGMDYIVSALVVERNNIKGGKSIIYGRDAKTEILNITLQPGQGILQPDKNSDLWHTVTAIECLEDKDIGYLSTIGFDISVI